VKQIVSHADAAAFLRRAEPWLAAAEAENNLLLGIARSLREGNNPYRDPISLITVEEGGAVTGCAWRTPPHNLGMTRLPMEALPALLEQIAALHSELPGMLGPPEPCRAAAELWAGPRGLTAETARELRIYELRSVAHPSAPPSGHYRLATVADRALAIAWTAAFQEDIDPEGPRHPDRGGLVDRLIASGSLGLWDNGEPVSMAAATSPTPNGVRINLVYTPPELRARGYASACVAALSQAQLDGGRRFCFLYTDLANPTSNSIYQRLGYRPVCDALELAFRS